MVNVSCSEGDNWQMQKGGVARVTTKIGDDLFTCSGSLVATTNNTCNPYFLFADHCACYDDVYSSSSDLNQWIFYFNYEANYCIGITGILSQSITGCQIKAHDSYGLTSTGSDFFLVLLNNDVPNNYYPYYNGWSRSTMASTSGVSIHHPGGIIKKISTYSTTLANYSTHWEVKWTSTTNGHSVTSSGSSGAPLFNSSKQIVGTLTGGSSYCDEPDEPDYYGKFSYHWSSNGTTSDKQLKPWLDPTNTGATYINGINYVDCPQMFINKENPKNIKIEIYPNPAKDFINITTDNIYLENAKITIYNIIGNIVFEEEISYNKNGYTIPVINLSNGIYFIKINDKKNSFNRKFIVNK